MSYALAHSVLSRMNMAPALVSSSAMSSVMADLRKLSEVEDEGLEDGAPLSRRTNLVGMYGYGPRQLGPEKPFAFAGGAAIIPIHGTLINRFFGSWSFVTGYNFIRAQLRAALEDGDVETVVFDVNSYGGETAGCFELAEEIRAARDQKPLLAVVDSNCCSAAYALASACSKVYVTPSGQAGSVGVIAVHMSISRMMESAGIDVTVIAEGAHKADGNPYEQLRPEVVEEIRADIAKSYGDFVELVVKNRPQLDSQAVRDTESRSFRANEALALKLIDAVKTPTEAVASFLAELGSEEPVEDEEAPMAEETKYTDADLSKARADGAQAAQARISAILSCDAAKGRSKLAAHLAFKTNMSVEDASAALEAAETEKVEEPPQDDKKPEGAEASSQGASAFERAMNGGSHPNVGADASSQDQEQPQPGGRGARALALIGRGSTKQQQQRTQH